MLACERHGSGEPLVLVHGMTHRRQAWYPVLDMLIAHREVILVDLPGHGESPDLVTDGRPVDEVLRREFTHFLEDQGLDRPHVAGNSLGGRMALEAGLHGQARTVTAFSPAGFWRTRASFAYTRTIFTSGAALLDRLGPRVEHLAKSHAGRKVIYGPMMAHPGRVSREHTVGDIRGFRDSVPAMRILLAAATPFDSAMPVSVPVTIAWGARDHVLPRWQAEVARATVPHAAHIVLRGAGHVPMWDDPKRVAEVLLQGSASVAEVTPIITERRRSLPTAVTA